MEKLSALQMLNRAKDAQKAKDQAKIDAKVKQFRDWRLKDSKLPVTWEFLDYECSAAILRKKICQAFRRYGFAYSADAVADLVSDAYVNAFSTPMKEGFTADRFLRRVALQAFYSRMRAMREEREARETLKNVAGKRLFGFYRYENDGDIADHLMTFDDAMTNVDSDTPSADIALEAVRQGMDLKGA